MKISKLIHLTFLWVGLYTPMLHAYESMKDRKAVITKTTWPFEIKNNAEFNNASRAEILIFLYIYKNKKFTTATAKSLGVKNINQDSIKLWQERLEDYWFHTFQQASSDCLNTKQIGCGFKGKTFNELLDFSEKSFKKFNKKYKPWRDASVQFYDVYIDELYRLAALFPHPTSEILPLNNAEVFGNRFKDGEFLLTFDDGPTPLGGNTDKNMKILRELNIPAYFFQLGQNLEKREQETSLKAIQKLYANRCLGSHGYAHHPHTEWAKWKWSIKQTRNIIHNIYPDKPVSFRPPYGMRNNKIDNVVTAEKGAYVFLWDIDSQDWNAEVNEHEAFLRVKKLILLYRKGIILFHDIHSKSLYAIPKLNQFINTTQNQWYDCHHLNK